MREFTREQFEQALDYRARNVTRDDEQLQTVSDNLSELFLLFIEAWQRTPYDAFAALFLYGMNIAYTINELECEPGDYHCLEHKAKNCECACESTSQVGKDEVMNPAGPRYF